MAKPSIEEHVALMSALDEDGKLAYLQRVAGGETSNALELDWRARLFTALHQANVWPHRREDGDCWEIEDVI